MQESELQIEQIAAPVTWGLRRTVLYPKGSLKDVQIEDDFDGMHFGAYQDNKLVGVISLFRRAEGSIQFRKFAVDEDYQGQGIGTALLQQVMDFSHQEAASELWCHARIDAAMFYSRFGFIKEGLGFVSKAIPYVRMVLKFPQASERK